jgi:hypothetical protein
MSKDPTQRYSASEMVEYFQKPEFSKIRLLIDGKTSQKQPAM